MAAQLFTFRLVPQIVAALVRRGIDGPALVAAAGLPAGATAGEVTVPVGRIEHFVALAADALGAPQFGLDLAALVPAGAYGLSEFVVRTAPTVATGLEMLSTFGALVNPIGRFTLSRGAGRLALHYAVAGRRDTLGLHLNEYTIAFIVRQFGAVLGEPLPLVDAWFSHARAAGADAVARALGCPIRFQAADCGFAITADVGARRPRTADEPLFEFLRAQARAQLANTAPGDPIAQVMRVVELRLGHGEVSIDAVAAAMATTSRSLQRHLLDHGTSFREVVHHVRLRRHGELSHGGHADGAIAKLLGFGSVSAMRRALAR